MTKKFKKQMNSVRVRVSTEENDAIRLDFILFPDNTGSVAYRYMTADDARLLASYLVAAALVSEGFDSVEYVGEDEEEG